ncbi:MAG: endonuclease/exonuclease/phosphatase family protein [Candidatus Paceibacterota bacterium]|jgi:endonuclease/exonuclease/phosphatase family metal-dependent hydrolase
MKIVSLNTWGGLAGKDLLLSFFEKYRNEVDIFCLQEIWAGPYKKLDGQVVGGRNLEHDKIMINGKQEISRILPNYTAYFRPHLMDHYGLLMLIKKDLEVLEEGEVFVHKEKGHIPEGDVGHHARNIQYIKIDTEKGSRTVINFHGLWNGKGKGDSEDRLLQSDKIVDFIKKASSPVVLCGDFNLLPETESLNKFEKIGLRNLIKENNIKSTRTSLYTKPEKYADYIFTSKDIKVEDFKVLPEEVSDHNALLLDFE